MASFGGTYSILNLGWTAMATHRLSSEVVSHNMANAATPGYSRQSADLQARQPQMTMAGPLGTGVEAISIHRAQDALLAQRLMDATADLGLGSGRVSVLMTAETVLGIGDDDPVGDALSGFFRSLEDLAANPSGGVERQQVLDQARRLGDTMAQVRGELSGVRQNLDHQVSQTVEGVQARLVEIAALNREIRQVEASGAQANDLRDRRELLAREIAERMEVSAFSDEHGQLNLMLTAGGVLVEGDRTATLEVEAVAANAGLLSPVLVSASGVRQRIDASISGELGGLLSARDGEVLQAIAELDQLAFDFASQVNAVHQSGTGLDGVGGRSLFSGLAAVGGAAANLRLDAAVDGQPDAVAAALDPAALPGDNRGALALAALAETDLMAGGSQTFGEYWRSSTAALGTGLNDAERNVQLHSSRLSQLSAIRESVAGVSIDEEMIELTKAQRAFEAAAKVIQTGDELLETILRLK